MKSRAAFLLIAFILVMNGIYSQEEKIDAGIFSGQSPDTLIIKARPTYTIPGQSMTNAQITIKWSESSPITELQWLYTSIGLFPQGPVIVSEGFRYQVYGSFGGSSLNWVSGQEYPILKLKTNSQSGECTEFEIAADDWALENNGEYYMEVLGEEKTGILYKPVVNFGSEGGFVDGDRTIYLGNTTGDLVLTGYSGNILQWERKINQGTWDILPGTAGLNMYEETPTLEGVWEYRVKVEKPGCPPEYSEPAIITVELLAIWTGAVSTSWEDPGNWNVVGVPDLNLDGKIPIVESGYYPLITGEALCKNLIVDDGAEVTVSQFGKFSMSGQIQNEGVVTLQSYTVSSASLLDNGTAGSGAFISKLVFNPGSYHLFASPVINSTSSSFEGMDLFEWYETEGLFIPLQPGDDTLGFAKGYLAGSEEQGNDLVIFEGSGLNTGPATATLTNNGDAGGHAGGFNLLGNPYPSALNFNDETNFILDQVDPTLYILDGESGNYGTYIRNDPGSSTLGMDSIIGIHQGFFLHVNHNHDAGSILINNGARIHDPRPLRSASNSRSPEPYLKLRVYGPESPRQDEIVVRFTEGATNGFDNAIDSYDLEGYNSPQLFTRGQDTLRLAVNSLPPLVLNTNVILGFQANEEGIFTFEVRELYNLGPDTLVVLEDLKMDMLYVLNQGQSITFQASPADDPNRFLLHFQVEPVDIQEIEDDFNVQISVSSSFIRIFTSDNESDGFADIFDASGRIILRRKISGSENFIGPVMKPGIYFVRVTAGKNSTSRKIVF